MWLALHPEVYSDIDEMTGYYKRVATPGPTDVLRGKSAVRLLNGLSS